MPTVPHRKLERFACDVLAAAGLASAEAAAAARALTYANLRGVDGHGVVRLSQYVATLAAGGVNARPDVRVIASRGATAVVDADGGYGFRPAALAMGRAVQLAHGHGIGAVGVRNSHHFGMAATYAEAAADARMVGILTTTSSPVLGPPGAARPVVGNNPFCCAVPRRPPAPPIVLDMALSEVAFGKVRLAAAEGRPIPPGWAFDEQGRPTTDPDAALRAHFLAAMGGHKGYGLSVVAEVLAGVMTGSPFALDSDAHGDPRGGVGHMAIAIRPDFFIEPDGFFDRLEALVEQIKSTPREQGAETLYLPGEREWATARARREAGVPLSDQLAARLCSLAAELHVDSVPWAGEPVS